MLYIKSLSDQNYCLLLMKFLKILPKFSSLNSDENSFWYLNFKYFAIIRKGQIFRNHFSKKKFVFYLNKLSLH